MLYLVMVVGQSGLIMCYVTGKSQTLASAATRLGMTATASIGRTLELYVSQTTVSRISTHKQICIARRLFFSFDITFTAYQIVLSRVKYRKSELISGFTNNNLNEQVIKFLFWAGVNSQKKE